MRIGKLITSLALALPFAAQARGLQPGWGGLAWGDPPARDMQRLEGSEAGLSYYKRESDPKTFCHFTVGTRYLFYKNRLISVGLSGFAEEMLKAEGCLKDRWGSATLAPGGSLVWLENGTQARLEARPPERGGGFHVMIISKKLWAWFEEEDRKSKAPTSPR